MYRAFKVRRIIGVCLAAALPWQALADPPSDAGLGQVEAILTFCAKSDPKLAPRAHEGMEQLAGHAREAARKTPAYQQGFNTLTELLAKLTPAQVAAGCAVLAPPKANGKPGRES